MDASWRFAGCANAIKGDLVRRGAFASAHIRENNRFPQSTLVAPTRLADRASMRGSVTLDAMRVFKNTRRYGGEALLPSGKCVYDTDLINRAFFIPNGPSRIKNQPKNRPNQKLLSRITQAKSNR
jgi:hypothetical protein